MTRNSQTIVKAFSHTNTTSTYQVVGNYQTIISEGHATRDDAAKSFDAAHPYVEESGYGIVSFVAPGQTVGGELAVANPDYVPPTDGEVKAANDALFEGYDIRG